MQILRNERKHDRVVSLVAHDMAVSVNSFPDGANFLSNTLAGLILNCNDDLKTCETQCFKSKPDDEPYCSGRYSFPCLT